MADAHTKGGSNHPPARNGLGALARVGWMVVGTVVILSLAMGIASRPAWSFGIRDILFWSAAFTTGLFRYIDVTRLEGQTANGDRATGADLRRYLVGLAATASALWVAAQSVWL
jgi:hypothetical protein